MQLPSSLPSCTLFPTTVTRTLSYGNIVAASTTAQSSGQTRMGTVLQLQLLSIHLDKLIWEQLQLLSIHLEKFTCGMWSKWAMLAVLHGTLLHRVAWNTVASCGRSLRTDIKRIAQQWLLTSALARPRHKVRLYAPVPGVVRPPPHARHRSLKENQGKTIQVISNLYALTYGRRWNHHCCIIVYRKNSSLQSRASAWHICHSIVEKCLDIKNRDILMLWTVSNFPTVRGRRIF